MKAKLVLLLLLSLMLGVSCQISPSPTQGEDSTENKISAIHDHLVDMRRQVDNRLSAIENSLTELKAGQALMKEKMKEVNKTLQDHSAMTAELNQNCCKLHTVESSMTALNSKVDFLASKVETVASATDNLNNTILVLAYDSNMLSSMVYNLTSKTDNLTHIFNTHNFETSTLNAKICSLDSRVDSLINTTDSILSHTGTLTSKFDILDSSMEILTNTTPPLPTQIRGLICTVAGVRVGQLALQQTIEEVKGNLSLLRERVEMLHSNADAQAKTITSHTTTEVSTAEGTCNKIVQPLNIVDVSQQQYPSRLPSPSLTSLSSCRKLAEDYPSAPSGYYWVRSHDGSPVSSYCIITSQLNPASSCQQLVQDHPQGASGYYWVRDGRNNTVTSYCIITSQLNPASSCQQLAQGHPQGAPGYYWVKDGINNTISSYCNITSLTQQNSASSCQQLAQDHPQHDSGYYWLMNGTGQLTKVYCDMERHCCNSTGGWMRVVYVDMTDPSQQCPSELRLRTDGSVRSCEIVQHGCTSTTFPSHGIEYSRVCGRVRAYQLGWPLAFENYFWNKHHNFTIDDWYVYGASITHGSSPRKHIWTFAAALSEYYSDDAACPCTHTDRRYTGAVPPFIGEDYFCDTADEVYSTKEPYIKDPLWDGQGCGPNSTCCSFNSPPWFCKQLPQPTTNDIELRMCGYFVNQTPVDHVELYIQ